MYLSLLGKKIINSPPHIYLLHNFYGTYSSMYPSFDCCYLVVECSHCSSQTILDGDDLLLLLPDSGKSGLVSWLPEGNAHKAELGVQSSSMSIKTWN